MMTAMTVKTVPGRVTEDLFSLIKQNYRFSYVADEEILQLVSFVRFKSWSKGSYVFMEGDPVTSFYILVTGKVEINMNNFKFAEKVFSIVGPGQMLGLPEIFNCHGVHTTNAFCEKDCTLAVVDKRHFREILGSLPTLSMAVCIYMGNMIGELRHELTLTGAESKILAYLKNLLSESGEKINGVIHVPRRISNDKLSRLLNITRETVSRTFKILKDKGIVEIRKDCYRILSEEGIENALPYYSCLPHYHE